MQWLTLENFFTVIPAFNSIKIPERVFRTITEQLENKLVEFQAFWTFLL